MKIVNVNFANLKSMNISAEFANIILIHVKFFINLMELVYVQNVTLKLKEIMPII